MIGIRGVMVFGLFFFSCGLRGARKCGCGGEGGARDSNLYVQMGFEAIYIVGNNIPY